MKLSYEVLVVSYAYPINDNLLYNPVQDKRVIGKTTNKHIANICTQRYIKQPNESVHIVAIEDLSVAQE